MEEQKRKALLGVVRQARQQLVLVEEELAILGGGADAPPDAELAELARLLYAQRRVRDRFFQGELFEDPAWDMLLDLYVAQHDNREVTITAASRAAQVPLTTGMRWIARLEEGGLIARGSSPVNRKLTLLTLTSDGLKRMTDLLNYIAADRDG